NYLLRRTITLLEPTILAKPGIYLEKIVITKPVSLISQNKDVIIREEIQETPLLTISSDNVTLTGFTMQNRGNFSNEGIILNSAHNCSLIKNTVTNFYTGIFINSSSNNILKDNIIDNNYFGIILHESSGNTLRGNNLNRNTFNIVEQNEFLNDIDSSNIIDDKPYMNIK
ncbi:MAG: NosD domain-containing protein, partial [Bacillota bacterium]